MCHYASGQLMVMSGGGGWRGRGGTALPHCHPACLDTLPGPPSPLYHLPPHRPLHFYFFAFSSLFTPPPASSVLFLFVPACPCYHLSSSSSQYLFFCLSFCNFFSTFCSVMWYSVGGSVCGSDDGLGEGGDGDGGDTHSSATCGRLGNSVCGG